MTDAISHGHAGSGGTGTNSKSGSDTRPAIAAISTIARNGSSRILTSAFHHAWNAAATKTAAKTNGSIYAFSLAPAGSYGALRLARTGTRSPAMSISKRAASQASSTRAPPV